MNNTKIIHRIFSFLRIFLAIGISLMISFILILFVSDDPISTMSNFIFGPLESMIRVGYIIEKMIPLMFTGVAACIMFSAGQVNLGGEGAFFMGGIVSTAIAIFVILPEGLHPATCIVAAGITGLIICGIPALMNIKFNSITMVISLMLNYICLNLGSYLLKNPLWDKSSGFPASYKFAQTSLLPKLFSKTNVHAGLFLAIIIIIIGDLIINRSILGYQIKMVGKNKNFAKYSGISVPYIILIAQLIGGFLCGAGGAIEQLGMYQRFQYLNLPGFGFDGVMIAVIAGYNPKYVPLAGLFIAYVRVGAETMARMSDVPSEIVLIVQSIVIMLIIAEEFLSNWKHMAVVKTSLSNLKKNDGNLS